VLWTCLKSGWGVQPCRSNLLVFIDFQIWRWAESFAFAEVLPQGVAGAQNRSSHVFDEVFRSTDNDSAIRIAELYSSRANVVDHTSLKCL
jgi:hypothetical protein